MRKEESFGLTDIVIFIYLCEEPVYLRKWNCKPCPPERSLQLNLIEPSIMVVIYCVEQLEKLLFGMFDE